jgi:hypothetical protein
VAPDQPCPVGLPLQPLDQVPNVVHQVLLIGLGANPVDAAGGVFPDIVPAFPQECLVDQPVEVEKPEVFSVPVPSLLLLALRLALLLRPFLAGQCFLCSLRIPVRPFPL